ncbi:MAG: NADH-quinone oxidoreductase subunit NuoE [Deltaproteobacteria bacterium]|nr:NADH-quinone oxidoreductase subunit NuoE [Deltaproteobacteria bacterium]
MSVQELDFSRVDEIIKQTPNKKGALIPVLQKVQKFYGYVPIESIERIADGLHVYPADVYGVLTFYSQFKLKPRGEYIVRVCCGTACHVKGSDRIAEDLITKLKVAVGETTEDRRFTLEKVACVGACALAPVVIVNEDVHAKMTSDETRKMITSLQKGQKE